MSDNTRDTQFQRFAELLLKDMTSINNGEVYVEAPGFRESIVKEWQNIIARRAYDLVGHALGYGLEYMCEHKDDKWGLRGTRIMMSIPDLTELPKEI